MAICQTCGGLDSLITVTIPYSEEGWTTVETEVCSQVCLDGFLLVLESWQKPQ